MKRIAVARAGCVVAMMALASIGLAVPVQADEGGLTIVAQGTTYKVPPVSSLQGASSHKSALQTIAIAHDALVAESAKLESEKQKRTASRDALAKRIEDASGRLQRFASNYEKRKNTFDRKVTSFKGRAAAHETNVDRHNAEVAANNALPAEQRNEATVSRLNGEIAPMSRTAQALEAELGTLQREESTLETDYQRALAFEKALRERMQDQKKLEARLKKIDIQLGTAYRQLQQCHAYGNSVRRILRDQYDVDEAPPKRWLEAEERMKELGDRSFDGGVARPPLDR